MRTVAFTTLGCKLNQYETQLIREHFEEAGYRIIPFTQPADIYVINTCTVTGRADRQSRNLVRRAHNLCAASQIIATGCYAQVAPEEVAAISPSVVVVPNTNKLQYIRDLLNVKLEHIHRFNGHTRAFIKVVNGCDRFCGYCIVPYARRGVESRPLSAIEVEAQQLVNNGYKEITLTGINIGSYGSERGSRLLDLLRRLAGMSGLRRLRLSSIEPEDLTDDLIDFISASQKLCYHLHIPLQSGDDELLRTMGRRYASQDYRQLVEKIVGKISDIGLGTDLIVGLPGEGDAQFENTYRLVEELPFAYLHVFRYSPRRGTKASQLPDKVTEKTKRRRSKLLMDLGNGKSYQFRRRFLGKTLEVLVESRRDKQGLLRGLSSNYLKVLCEGPDSLYNQFVKLKITRVTPSETHGEREAVDTDRHRNVFQH